MCPYLNCVRVCVSARVCSCICVSLCVSEWMSAVRCCSMLCQLHLEPSVLGLSGRGVDDFNVLEPQTDLSQTVVSMKARQLGPVKLNRLIWVVSRRQTLWLHSNPRSDSLGNPPADWYTQTLESVCFNDRRDVFYMRAPSPFLSCQGCAAYFLRCILGLLFVSAKC